MSKKKLIKRCKSGDTVEKSDNTRVQMPRTDVEPIKIPDEELKWMGWRERTYPNGETYMVPPPTPGTLTPVYPEFDLLTLVRSLFTMPIEAIGFREVPDSWTRGIGKEGLDDIIETGVVRGNPRGTEVTAKQFAKLNRKNRNHFRDIIDDVNIPGIEQRYFSRTLSESDFKALKEAAKKYKTSDKSILRDITDPLEKYNTYDDYLKAIRNDVIEVNTMPSKIKSGEVKVNNNLTKNINDDLPTGRPINERFGSNSDYVADGHPLSYWYPDGRNPMKRGYDYVNSDYSVRVLNASNHKPFMHEYHLHPSFWESPKLIDPDVQIFKKGIFGIPIQLNKNNLTQSLHLPVFGFSPLLSGE